jgi:hypothetical protein
MSLGLLLITILVLSCSSTSIFNLQNRTLAQQSTSPPTSNSWGNNTTSASKEHLSLELLNQIKLMILKNIGNKSKGGGASRIIDVTTPNVPVSPVMETYLKQILQSK